jgi:hypothetical protein
MKKIIKTPQKRAATAKSKPRTIAESDHPIQQHANEIRDIVHAALADHGINDLSLSAMHFSAEASSQDPCPPNQHREMICKTGADGSQICQWECVPN